MLLQIPHCKQAMTLLADVTTSFQTRYPTNHEKLATALGLIRCDDVGRLLFAESGKFIEWEDMSEVTLPKGTVLQINKLYIRNGGWDEDYVSFRIVSSPLAGAKGKIIQIPLSIVNTMDVEMHPETV